MQGYTVYFIWKLLYMFRVVPPPIIRSANKSIYSIWYLSHRYCYLPLWNWFECAVGGVLLLLLLLLLLLRWRYSPLWALACQTILLHFSLSITNSLHLLTPSTWWSLSAYSHLPFLGLRLRLLPSSSWVKIFLGILFSSILSRWPSQVNLCPFIHFTTFSPLLNSSSSRFVLLLIITGICPTILAKPMRNAAKIVRAEIRKRAHSTNKNLPAVRQPPPARFNDRITTNVG